MKFILISKVFVRSLLYAFVLVASLNHSLSYGNYINDDILKSVKSSATESSSNLIQPESLDGIVHHNAGYGRDQNGNYFFAMSFAPVDVPVAAPPSQVIFKGLLFNFIFPPQILNYF